MQVEPIAGKILLKKFIKNHERSGGLNVAIESLREKNYSGFFYALKNVLNKRPSIFIYVLWFSLLEVLKMFYEKIFSSARNI